VDPAGGIRVNLTGSGTQTLGIYDTTGLLMGSFDDLGVLTARKLVANDLLTVGGTDLVETIRKLPRGVVAASSTFPGDESNVNSEWGLTEVMFTIPEHLDSIPRLYRLTADLILSYASKVEFKVRYTRDGTAPTITSSTMGTRIMNGTNIYTSFSPQWYWAFDEPAGTPIRCLLTVQSGAGDFGWINSMNPRFIIEDVGEFVGFGGQVSAGGGTSREAPRSRPRRPLPRSSTSRCGRPPRPELRRIERCHGHQVRSRRGVRGEHLPDAGLLPVGCRRGPLRSHMFFDYQDIYNNLQGATIQGVEIYLMNVHWYASSGGLAKIAVHNYATAPNNFGTSSPIQNEPFARGEGKWVWLSGAVATGFQNGTVKGLSLDSARLLRSPTTATSAGSTGSPRFASPTRSEARMSVLLPPEDGAIMDDAARTVALPDGRVVPYTDQQVAIMKRVIVIEDETTTRDALSGGAPAAIEALKATKVSLLNLTDPTINANPAAAIKMMARAMRDVATEVIRLEKIVNKQLADSDLGE
jgi:hypothetical protein